MVFVLTAFAMAALFVAYYVSIFGEASPLAIYGGVPRDASGSPLHALLGLLLDSTFGLLPHAPAYLLALVGLWAFARRPFWSAWPYGLVGAAVLLPVLFWRMWWGGQCPPARFLVPLVPLLALAVAWAAQGPVRGLLRWRGALLAAGVGLIVFAVADPGRSFLLNRANRPSRLWAALSGEGSVGRYLPSLTRPEAADTRVALLWTFALVALLVLDQRARRSETVDRWFRGLGLPVALFLSLGLAVDHWARPRWGSPPAPVPAVAGEAEAVP